MSNVSPVTPIIQDQFNDTSKPHLVIQAKDVGMMMDRHQYSDDTRNIIKTENLLPIGLLSRLHASFPTHSGLMETKPFLFTGRDKFSGLKGFHRVVDTLQENGIEIGHMDSRDLFVEVYSFLATRHTLNSINWDDFRDDAVFQLCFAQPGMIND